MQQQLPGSHRIHWRIREFWNGLGGKDLRSSKANPSLGHFQSPGAIPELCEHPVPGAPIPRRCQDKGRSRSLAVPVILELCLIPAPSPGWAGLRRSCALTAAAAREGSWSTSSPTRPGSSSASTWAPSATNLSSKELKPQRKLSFFRG